MILIDESVIIYCDWMCTLPTLAVMYTKELMEHVSQYLKSILEAMQNKVTKDNGGASDSVDGKSADNKG